MKPFNKGVSGRADDECRIVLVHTTLWISHLVGIVSLLTNSRSRWAGAATVLWCVTCEQKLFDHWLEW